MQNITRSSIGVVKKTMAVGSVSLVAPCATAAFLYLQMAGLSSQVPRPTARAQDPGPRAGAIGAGGPIAGLTSPENEYFMAGRDEFVDAEDVTDGLGPTLNLDSCVGCHSQPATGGTSPALNPQIAFVNKNGGTDKLPSFITANGPAREARFVMNRDGTPDGGVHAVFTITGRAGAGRCSLTQPDFDQQMANHNVIFRIPTPTFGLGLVEQIPDSAIAANITDDGPTKSALGIRGRANFAVAGRTISGQTNNNGNDGTIARFGWKAQNKSLLLFAGEAYNVEMGISNELFPTERDETPNCQVATRPNSITHPEATTTIDALSAIEKFAFFMRLLAPPTPSTTTPGGAPSISSGQRLFTKVGCTLCHTPSLHDRQLRSRRAAKQVRRISTPISCCTTWATDSPTASARDRRARESSAPRRCGDWGSDCFSFTTAERQTCWPRSPRIRAQDRKPTPWSPLSRP